MTIPSSGPITLNDIAAEFGGSTPHSLNEYYAGGPYVPSGTTGVNGAVPTSGTISFNHFYGTSAAVLLDTQSVTKYVFPTTGSPPYGPFISQEGYVSGFGGSISDGTSNIYGGAAFYAVVQTITNSFPSDTSYTFSIVISGNRANSGWSSVKIGGVTLTRASASYSYSSGTNRTTWIWSGAPWTASNPDVLYFYA